MSIVNIARCPEHGLHGCRTTCLVCDGPVEQVPMVAVDYFSRYELDWLQSAARRAAGDRIATGAAASDALLELARKVRRLKTAEAS